MRHATEASTRASKKMCRDEHMDEWELVRDDWMVCDFDHPDAESTRHDAARIVQRSYRNYIARFPYVGYRCTTCDEGTRTRFDHDVAVWRTPSGGHVVCCSVWHHRMITPHRPLCRVKERAYARRKKCTARVRTSTRS